MQKPEYESPKMEQVICEPVDVICLSVEQPSESEDWGMPFRTEGGNEIR